MTKNKLKCEMCGRELLRSRFIYYDPNICHDCKDEYEGKNRVSLSEKFRQGDV